MSSPQPKQDNLSSDSSEEEVKSKYGSQGNTLYETPAQEICRTHSSDDEGDPCPKMAIAECCSDGLGSSLLVSGNPQIDCIRDKILKEKFEAVEKLKQKEKALEEAKNILEKQETEIENLRKDNEDLSGKNEGLKDRLREAEESKKKAQSQCATLSNEVKKLKTKVESLNIKVSELTEEVKKLSEMGDKEKTEVQARLDSIEQGSRSERAEHQIRDQHLDERLQTIIRMLERRGSSGSGQRNTDIPDSKSYDIGSKDLYKDKRQ